jgi:hypothetical protein
MNRTSKILLLLTVSASFVAPSYAQNVFNIDIGRAPPPQRYEVVPPAQPGHIWAPGYWAWEGDHHRWNSGRWIESRPGYSWKAEHWERHDGKWRLQPGNWVHDVNWDHNRDWNEHPDWNRHEDNDQDWGRNDEHENHGHKHTNNGHHKGGHH